MPSIVIHRRCYPALVAQGEDLLNRIEQPISNITFSLFSEKRRRSPTPDQNRDKKTGIKTIEILTLQTSFLKHKFNFIAGGITRDQHEKLKAQQKQYHDAKEKLEAQLLKLKEQRETLKEDGAVHDDQIMKENAKLQVSLKPNYIQ